MLESIGFPSYAITYENITKIDVNKFIDVIIACLVTFLNFYAMILLVFKVKEAKKIFKYAVLYLVTYIQAKIGNIYYMQLYQ